MIVNTERREVKYCKCCTIEHKKSKTKRALSTHSFCQHLSCYEATSLPRFTAPKATCVQKQLATVTPSKPACYVQSQLLHYVLLMLVLRQFCTLMLIVLQTCRAQRLTKFVSLQNNASFSSHTFIIFESASYYLSSTGVDKREVEPKLPAGQAREHWTKRDKSTTKKKKMY